MTTWFTSDLHIGHKNIIKYCKRPWASAAEMDEALIANWNSVVKPDDTVWDLGDFAFCTSPGHALEVWQSLAGRHHVILGNHDELLLKLHGLSVAWLGDGFKSVNVEDQEIVLCHYAMREWQHAVQGVWHLFGHTHAGLGPYGKSVDVGVDNAYAVLGMRQFTPESYRPVSFAEVKAFMDKQPLGPHPAFAGVGFPKMKEE